MNVFRYIWHSVRRDPRRLLRPGALILGATLVVLVALLVLRSLALSNVPEVRPLLGTLDTVIALLSLTFLAQLALAALSFEVLRIEAQQEDAER